MMWSCSNHWRSTVKDQFKPASQVTNQEHIILFPCLAHAVLTSDMDTDRYIHYVLKVTVCKFTDKAWEKLKYIVFFFFSLYCRILVSLLLLPQNFDVNWLNLEVWSFYEVRTFTVMTPGFFARQDWHCEHISVAGAQMLNKYSTGF